MIIVNFCLLRLLLLLPIPTFVHLFRSFVPVYDFYLCDDYYYYDYCNCRHVLFCCTLLLLLLLLVECVCAVDVDGVTVASLTILPHLCGALGPTERQLHIFMHREWQTRDDIERRDTIHILVACHTRISYICMQCNAIEYYSGFELRTIEHIRSLVYVRRDK